MMTMRDMMTMSDPSPVEDDDDDVNEFSADEDEGDDEDLEVDDDLDSDSTDDDEDFDIPVCFLRLQFVFWLCIFVSFAFTRAWRNDQISSTAFLFDRNNWLSYKVSCLSSSTLLYTPALIWR